MKHAINIRLTIGELGDALKNFDTYGLFLRGFDPATGAVEDEPEKELETVLTLTLSVESDLEPVWTLISDRATAQNVHTKSDLGRSCGAFTNADRRPG